MVYAVENQGRIVAAWLPRRNQLHVEAEVFAFFSSFKCPLEFCCEKSVMKIESVKGGEYVIWVVICC